MRIAKRSTRQLLGISSISPKGIERNDGEIIIYYQIQPTNLSVLSSEIIKNKVYELLDLIRENKQLEITCLDSRESFKENKIFLKQRINAETNPKLKELLKEDLVAIENESLDTNGKRTFLIGLRFISGQLKDLDSILARFNSLSLSNGLQLHQLSQQETMTLMAVWFKQDVTTETFESMDGRRFIIDEANI